MDKTERKLIYQTRTRVDRLFPVARALSIASADSIPSLGVELRGNLASIEESWSELGNDSDLINYSREVSEAITEFLDARKEMEMGEAIPEGHCPWCCAELFEYEGNVFCTSCGKPIFRALSLMSERMEYGPGFEEVFKYFHRNADNLTKESLASFNSTDES